MGFLNGGLIGAILRNAARQKQNDDIRRAIAEEWYNSYTQPRSMGGGKRWECRFCGMKMNSYGGGGSTRPSAKLGGGCSHSPYGSHYWEEY